MTIIIISTVCDHRGHDSIDKPQRSFSVEHVISFYNQAPKVHSLQGVSCLENTIFKSTAAAFNIIVVIALLFSAIPIISLHGQLSKAWWRWRSAGSNVYMMKNENPFMLFPSLTGVTQNKSGRQKKQHLTNLWYRSITLLSKWLYHNPVCIILTTYFSF